MTSVLLVGLGRWGANHLRILRSLPITLYCADTDPARLDALVKSGFPADHAGADAMAFLPKVDCVVVATPAPHHFAFTKACLEAGKDVLVEKPLTLVGAESKILAELAQKTGRILQVGHIFLYDPASLWMRDAAARGEFGKLKLLRGNFSGFKRPRTDGGVSFADAIHFAALFNFIVGLPPKCVTGHLCDFFGRGMDDQSLIVLDYELPPSANGTGGRVMAQIETGYHVPGKFRDVTVTGDKLSAACDFNVAQYKIKTTEARHEPAKNGEIGAVEGTVKQLEFPPAEVLLEEIRAFLDCVATRKAPLADAWSGYWSVRVIETAIESARLGKTLDL